MGFPASEIMKKMFFFSNFYRNLQGDQGDKGDRGLTTTFKGDQFPTGIIEGPPGPPGPAGKLIYLDVITTVNSLILCFMETIFFYELSELKSHSIDF